MAGWSGGYSSESPYAIAWQAAQTPVHAGLVCAMAGVDWYPRPEMVVADIGCGRGYAAGVLAAANPGWTVIGLDHTPAHVAEARSLGERAGLPNLGFIEADLGDMTDAAMDALPPLDVAMLHGVWSWVSDSVRAGVARLLARRLKPGGIVYVGYNALPAAGLDHGLQRLFRDLAGVAQGTAAERAGAAMAAIRAMAPNPEQALPPGLPRTAMLKRILNPESGLEPGFLAHEFLTEHWRPVFHADLCAALAPARLSFVGSANLLENRPGMLGPPPPPGVAAETWKDLALSRPFRADVFQRGPRRADATAMLDRIVLGAVVALPPQGPRIATPAGIASLPATIWAPIATALADGPCSLGALRRAAPAAPVDAADLLVLLVDGGLALPLLAWGQGDGAAARRFNLSAAALHGGVAPSSARYALASAVGGGGVACSALDLALFAELVARGGIDPPELAPRLLPDATQDAQARAAERIGEILAERIPVWSRFGIL